MRRFRLVIIIGGLLIVALVATSGRFLVVNQPRKSDVIVVLAGETDRRPARGLELLDQGYAPRLILDVPAEAKIYHWSQLEIARKYVSELPQASAITVCPIYGRSTRDEALDVARCLRGEKTNSILLVTSDYHTRRALSIFKRVLPTDYSIAAAFDASEFGVQWWRHREWAKVNFEEWSKLIWWKLVDRWR
ncbi:MAG: YdcF family protein, partial [Terriglobales bacterium]